MKKIQSTRGPMGPESLTCILVRRGGCLPQNIIPILGITQFTTKAYQVTKFNQIILIFKIKSLTSLPNPKGQGGAFCQTFKMHNVMCTIPFFRKKGFYLLSPYRNQGCVIGQNICMHGVKCFIIINLISNMPTFKKENKLAF